MQLFQISMFKLFQYSKSQANTVISALYRISFNQDVNLSDTCPEKLNSC